MKIDIKETIYPTEDRWNFILSWTIREKNDTDYVSYQCVYHSEEYIDKEIMEKIIRKTKSIIQEKGVIRLCKEK